MKMMTTKMIAEEMGITVRAVNFRATTEKWAFQPRNGRGGGKIFPFATLPQYVKDAIIASEKTKLKDTIVSYSPTTPAPQSVSVPLIDSPVSTGGNLRMQSRLALIGLCQSYIKDSGKKFTPALQDFAVRWNSGLIEAEPWLKEALPTVSHISLRNWILKSQKQDRTALKGDYGKRQSKIDTDPQMYALVTGMLAEHPSVSAVLIHEALLARFGEVQALSLRAVQDWLQKWKKKNASLWQYIKAPDSWRNKFMSACGTSYEHIVRQNQRWEYDGTPSDIMLDDGKRYTIIGVINIYDRRLKLEVVPTSTARDVGNITRRCLLDWGVPEEIVTDNGKDFVARYVQQIMFDLNIRQTILPPFRPDLKPGIERAFKSFSHHLLTIAPCYVGHNVATRQEIRERETFAKRLFEKEADLSIAMTPEALQEFCDTWTDDIYAHRKHSGLNGKTPFSVASSWHGVIRRIENERALDLLLTPLAEAGGWRTVSKKGIRANGLYVAPELGGLVGERMQVRIDPSNRYFAYVFNENGEFVCRAENSSMLDSESKQTIALAARRRGQALVKSEAAKLRKNAKDTGAKTIMNDIVDYHKKRSQEIRNQACESYKNEISYSTNMLENAALAAGEQKTQNLTDAQAAAVRKQAEEALKMRFIAPSSPARRDELRHILNTRLANGEMLSTEESAWLKRYELSAEARAYDEMNSLFRQVAN